MLSFEELKKVIKAQEGQQETQPKKQQRGDNLQRERLEIQRERLEIQRERLEMEKQKQQQRTQQKANKNELVIYLFSILLTFATILSSVVLFIIILIKG